VFKKTFRIKKKINLIYLVIVFIGILNLYGLFNSPILASYHQYRCDLQRNVFCCPQEGGHGASICEGGASICEGGARIAEN
jgi:hypothetical protein